MFLSDFILYFITVKQLQKRVCYDPHKAIDMYFIS